MSIRHMTALGCLLFCAAACGAGPAPATSPADAVSTAAVEQWLDRIEKRSADIKSVHADKIRYDRIQGIMRDEQRRFGKLIYVTGPPAKFAVHFDRLVTADRKLTVQNRWYIFDGMWLIERLDDKKQFFKRQVVAPDAPKEAANPLELGSGPFAIPITLKKDQVLRRFNVTLAPPAEGDPEQTVHLRLVPKPGHKSEYTRVDVWWDTQSLLPRRARTIDDSENESIIHLDELRLNEPVDLRTFDTSAPKGRDWLVEVTPWEP